MYLKAKHNVNWKIPWKPGPSHKWCKHASISKRVETLVKTVIGLLKWCSQSWSFDLFPALEHVSVTRGDLWVPSGLASLEIEPVCFTLNHCIDVSSKTLGLNWDLVAHVSFENTCALTWKNISKPLISNQKSLKSAQTNSFSKENPGRWLTNIWLLWTMYFFWVPRQWSSKAVQSLRVSASKRVTASRHINVKSCCLSSAKTQRMFGVMMNDGKASHFLGQLSWEQYVRDLQREELASETPRRKTLQADHARRKALT